MRVGYKDSKAVDTDYLVSRIAIVEGVYDLEKSSARMEVIIAAAQNTTHMYVLSPRYISLSHP